MAKDLMYIFWTITFALVFLFIVFMNGDGGDMELGLTGFGIFFSGIIAMACSMVNNGNNIRAAKKAAPYRWIGIERHKPFSYYGHICDPNKDRVLGSATLRNHSVYDRVPGRDAYGTDGTAYRCAKLHRSPDGMIYISYHTETAYRTETESIRKISDLAWEVLDTEEFLSPQHRDMIFNTFGASAMNKLPAMAEAA